MRDMPATRPAVKGGGAPPIRSGLIHISDEAAERRRWGRGLHCDGHSVTRRYSRSPRRVSGNTPPHTHTHTRARAFFGTHTFALRKTLEHSRFRLPVRQWAGAGAHYRVCPPTLARKVQSSTTSSNERGGAEAAAAARSFHGPPTEREWDIGVGGHELRRHCRTAVGGRRRPWARDRRRNQATDVAVTKSRS